MMRYAPTTCFLGLLLAWPFGCAPPQADGDGDGDVDADGDGDGDSDTDADSDTRIFACNPGEWNCWQNSYYECESDGASRLNETLCDEVCSPDLGCVFCVAGSRRCEGNVSMVCASSADRWFFGRDCTDWGSTCVEGTGFCGDACAEAETGDSYVGCEYWPTPLANTSELDQTIFDFRVAVANPNTAPANVRIEQGGAIVTEVSVAAGGLEEVVLPWVAGQSFGIGGDDWQSIDVPNGAYRLVSDLPVTVSQFNPFEYAAGGDFSHTNDATLLLPTHVLTGDYVGLTYFPFSRRTGNVGQPFTFNTAKLPDYIAVVGVAPEPTQVEVLLTGHVARANTGIFGDVAPGDTISFTVQRGEVVHITSAVHPNCTETGPGYNREEECTGIGAFRICEFLDTCAESGFDLTGSRVTADRPVVVFGGHVCAYVPYTSQACDHLEVQMPPIQTWGRGFVSAPMVDTGTNYENLVRVIAAFDGTSVTVDPPQGGVSEAELSAGEFVEFLAQGPFQVTGSEAIMVGQFMLGQYYPEPDAQRGDPAMTVLVPAEQYRADYTFSTPTSYRADTNGQSYVLVVRPPELELTLDGAPVTTTWQPVGGQEIGIVPLGGGTHSMSGELPFGMIAYGLGSFTSYAYPAGLNLEQITPLI